MYGGLNEERLLGSGWWVKEKKQAQSEQEFASSPLPTERHAVFYDLVHKYISALQFGLLKKKHFHHSVIYI